MKNWSSLQRVNLRVQPALVRVSTQRHCKMQMNNHISREKMSSVSSTPYWFTDFNNLKSAIQPKECCYILFKYKEAFESSPWALLSIIPDDVPVNERMICSSTVGRVKEIFGPSNFGEDRRFSDLNELTWANFKGVQGGAVASGDKGNPETHPEKPWSARELAQHQLDVGEMQARKEYAQGKQTPGGYHSIDIPLSPEAQEALKALQEKRVNWVQLAIDDAGKVMNVVTSKHVSSPLAPLVDKTQAQFYLYDYNGTLALIYCCPEEAPMKHRMMYPASRATLAEKLKAMGFAVRKLDIFKGEELTDNALQDMMRRQSATVFKPDPSVLSGPAVTSNTPYSSTGGRIFNPSEFDTNKPVFNRPGFTQPHEVSSTANKARHVKQGESPSAMRVLTGDSAKDSRKPRGIVIPPDGAYC